LMLAVFAEFPAQAKAADSLVWRQNRARCARSGLFSPPLSREASS
jgi:hypothetical protein